MTIHVVYGGITCCVTQGLLAISYLCVSDVSLELATATDFIASEDVMQIQTWNHSAYSLFTILVGKKGHIPLIITRLELLNKSFSPAAPT